MKIFGNTFEALAKQMDLALERHRTLAGNAANHSTPKYVAQDFSFGNELEKVLNGKANEDISKTNSMHMDIASNDSAQIVMDLATPFKADGNNVDLDLTMGKIAQNARSYSSASTYMQMELRLIKLASKISAGA